MADEHAALALPPKADYAVEVLNAPPVLRVLARRGAPL
jgi:hypothetical protein